MLKSLTYVKSNISRLNKLDPNILLFITYGLVADMGINLYKPFAAKFLERLGGTQVDISLYNSLPGLAAALILIPSAVLLSRFSDKRLVTSVLFLISRFVLLLTAFVPVLPEPSRALAFVVLMSLMNLPEATAQSSFQAVLGVVFEPKVRATAISLRGKFANIVVLATTLTTGLIISYLPKTDSQRLFSYQLFFIAAFLIGLVEIFMFRKFKVPQGTSAPAKRIKLKSVLAVLKNKKFARFLLTVMVFHFAWQASVPLFTIHQIIGLKANEMWLAICSLGTCVGSFLGAGYWSRLINKRGNTYALVLAIGFMGISTLLFAFSPTIFHMSIVSIFSGFSLIGTTTTLFNGLLEASPDEDRIFYIAAYNSFANIILFIAPLFGLLLLNSIGVLYGLILVGTMRLVSSGIIYISMKKTKERD